MTKNKDNPVPSLETIKNSEWGNIRDSILEVPFDKLDEFLEFLKGVETNKEQPHDEEYPDW